MTAKGKGALRYHSIETMPTRLRDMVLAQNEKRETPAVEPSTKTARRPTRDAEHTEQVVFFNRIRTLALNNAAYGDAARRTFAIPNGGGRTKREAGRLKAEGVTAGVADIFCSIARGGSHGFYIEMKSLIGYPSREQKQWISDSLAQGYQAGFFRGAEAAFTAWKEYVDEKS